MGRQVTFLREILNCSGAHPGRRCAVADLAPKRHGAVRYQSPRKRPHRPHSPAARCLTTQPSWLNQFQLKRWTCRSRGRTCRRRRRLRGCAVGWAVGMNWLCRSSAYAWHTGNRRPVLRRLGAQHRRRVQVRNGCKTRRRDRQRGSAVGGRGAEATPAQASVRAGVVGFDAARLRAVRTDRPPSWRFIRAGAVLIDGHDARRPTGGTRILPVGGEGHGKFLDDEDRRPRRSGEVKFHRRRRAVLASVPSWWPKQGAGKQPDYNPVNSTVSLRGARRRRNHLFAAGRWVDAEGRRPQLRANAPTGEGTTPPSSR